jgi:hypothetical protein
LGERLRGGGLLRKAGSGKREQGNNEREISGDSHGRNLATSTGKT